MKHSTLAVAILFCTAASIGYGQTPPAGTEPDNTRMNQRDRKPGQATADQQKVNATDQELTRNIRKSIVGDKAISTYGKNIKIITQNGSVTLKGPVKSDEEKKSIVAKAVAVVGSADKVTDQVSVKH